MDADRADDLARALAEPLQDQRGVSEREGGGGRKLTYLASWFVIDQANRLFGPNWGHDIVELGLVPGTEDKFFARVRITVPGFLPKEDVGFGSVGPRKTDDEYDKALKTAVSDGMKRAFRQFGAQFGNLLYAGNRPGAGSDRSPTPLRPAQPTQALAPRPCEQCQQPVLGYTAENGQVTHPGEIIAATRRAYGKALCRTCALAARASGTPVGAS